MYAHTPRAKLLALEAAINIVFTPSHRITAINVQVDAATKEEPQTDLTLKLRHPYTFLPPEKFRDHYQLLQGRAHLQQQYLHRMQRHVQGPFVGVPWAAASQATGRVLEERHCLRSIHGSTSSMPVMIKTVCRTRNTHSQYCGGMGGVRCHTIVCPAALSV